MVGLTLVAVGTSLPELAASLVAARRGHASMAVGNVIGSNIFNVLFVLGGAAAIRPIEGSLRAMRLDVGALVVASIAAAYMLRKERVLGRLEGAALLVGYVVFLGLVAIAR